MSARSILISNLGGKCEVCGSKTRLEFHHIDGDRKNHNLKNIQLLCRSCHHAVWHGSGQRIAVDILKTIQKKPRLTPKLIADEINRPIQPVRNMVAIINDLELVETSARGLYQITELGKTVLNSITRRQTRTNLINSEPQEKPE